MKSGPVSALLAFCATGAHESKPPRNSVDRPAKLANMSIVKIGHFEVNLGRKLGEGGFGAVYRAKDTSQDPPAECAAKQVKYEKDAGQRAATEREAAFLRKVGAHNSIIGLFGLEIVDGHENAACKKSAWIFMEIATGGELFDRLIDSGSLTEKAVRPYFAALLSGVGAMHAAGVVHRDLKLENVMLCAEDPRAVKIVDFGLAVDYTAGQLFREKVGSKSYRSPEILAGAGYEGPPADVWALGIVIFSLAAGFFPLDEARSTDWRFARLAQEQAKEVGACDAIFAMYKRACPFTQDFKAMLDGMLTIDPKKRATVAGLSENRWLETPKIGAQGEYDDDGVVYRSLGGGDDDEARPPLQLDEMMPTIGRQRAGCLE